MTILYVGVNAVILTAAPAAELAGAEERVAAVATTRLFGDLAGRGLATMIALGLVSTGLYVTVLELGAALVLLAFAGGLFAQRSWRGTRTIRAVGRLSYEIYLTHMFVVFATVALFHATGANLAFVGAWYAAALLASALLGYFVARSYSTPANAAIRDWLLTEARPASARHDRAPDTAALSAAISPP